MKLEWRPGGKKKAEADPMEGLTPEQMADAEAAKKQGEEMAQSFQKRTGALAAENEAFMDDLQKKNQQEIAALKKKSGGKYEKF